MPIEPARARAFVLHKQGLAGAGLDGLDAATAATGGVYGTAPTCYLTYAARVGGSALDQLDQAVYRDRRLVRLRAMRGSSYLVPAGRLAAVVAATGWLGERAARAAAKASGLDQGAFDQLADRIEQAMAGRPPLTKAELRVLVDARAGLVDWAVVLLCAKARLVRADVRGGWRSDTYAYARWADWLGANLEPLGERAAHAELARAYLRAYGPATVADLAWWSGLGLRAAAAASADLGEEVEPVTLRGPDGTAAEPALVLAAEAGALAATDPGAAAGVRLLPVWDAYLMGYAKGPAARARVLAPADYERVYDAAGNGTATLLVDGAVAGVWELAPAAAKGAAGRLAVTVAPFKAPGRRLRAAVEAAAAELATRTGHEDAQVSWAEPPGRLADGARNAFMAPVRLGARR